MMIKKVSSGTPWESEIGYSRAIRRGPYIAVSGTTAMEGDKLIAKGDASQQAAFIFQKMIDALAKLGAKPKDVIRTRMYIVNVDDANAVTKVHARFFKEIKPAATLLVVKGFINPDLLVEIEMDAYLL